jgi:hypothetical protein
LNLSIHTACPAIAGALPARHLVVQSRMYRYIMDEPMPSVEKDSGFPRTFSFSHSNDFMPDKLHFTKQKLGFLAA